MRFVRVVLMIASVFTAAGLLAYDWPMKPFDRQHEITSTFGESRGTRFHTGVDVTPWDTASTDTLWLVYSLRSDTMLRYNHTNPQYNGVYDDDSLFWYLHLTNRVPESTFVTAFVDTIGRIRTDMDHCHLTERDANGVRINPLRPGALSPFIDTVPPIIESVSFKRQGSGTHLHCYVPGKMVKKAHFLVETS